MKSLFQSEAAAGVQAQLYCTSLLVQAKEPNVTTIPLKPPRDQPFLKCKKTLLFSNVSYAGGGD